MGDIILSAIVFQVAYGACMLATGILVMYAYPRIRKKIKSLSPENRVFVEAVIRGTLENIEHQIKTKEAQEIAKMAKNAIISKLSKHNIKITDEELTEIVTMISKELKGKKDD